MRLSKDLMKSTLRAFAVNALLVGFGLVAGCGRAPDAAAPSPAVESAPAPAPPAATRDDALADREQAEPATLADAEALLEKARSELDALALNEPAAPVAAGAPGAATSPQKATASEARRAEKSAAEAAPAAQAPKDASPCEVACKAFASLVRASDAVCRLDTDGGKRCERAQRIRGDAQVRVAGCGCAK